MGIQMGPALRFSGYEATTNVWRLTALVVADTAPGKLTFGDGASSSPRELWRHGGRAAYRYELYAILTSASSRLTYHLDGKTFEVALPAAGMPPQMAYGSCNGFSSLKAMKGIKDNNSLWKELKKRHDFSPYHLLLLGGDQVYADPMWETLPTLKAWSKLSYDDANTATFTPQMQAELTEFYFDLYTDRWAQPEVAAVLATVPTVMMWDDHDIFDGWGSYPKERQDCDVYKGIWRTARHAFSVFQQHTIDEFRENALYANNAFTFAH